MKIYLKRDNKISEIEITAAQNNKWLPQKPNNISEYDFLCQMYIGNLSPNFSDEFSTSSEQEYNAQQSIILKNEAILAIKSEAGRRITSLYPEYKQRNLIGAVSLIQNKELLALKAGSGNYTPTEEEMVLLRAAKACKEFIDAIRAKSNELEASLDSMTEEQLNAFDPSEDSNWE